MVGTLTTHTTGGTVTPPSDGPTTTPRIVPSRREPRAPAPPHHDGPDSRSATPLDGATALLLAYRRRRAARLALGERPAAAAGPRGPYRDVQLPDGFTAGDVDDEGV